MVSAIPLDWLARRVLRDGNCGLPRLDGLDVHCALLLGHPAFVDQGFVAAPCILRELEARVGLVPRRLELIERRLVLRNLVIELRHCELRQQISCLDAIPDVDVALGDVAGRAGIDTRRGECSRRAGQGDRNRRSAPRRGRRSPLGSCRPPWPLPSSVQGGFGCGLRQGRRGTRSAL
jgi:hypothetical protein